MNLEGLTEKEILGILFELSASNFEVYKPLIQKIINQLDLPYSTMTKTFERLEYIAKKLVGGKK